MKKTIGGIVVTAILSATPMIPQEMEFQLAYVTPYRDIPAQIVPATATATQKIIPAHKSDFPDSGDGNIYVAVFSDSKGNRVSLPITKEKYESMGVRGGYANNPKNTEYKSIFETLLLTPAEAAIAFDAVATGGSDASASSVTFAKTNTGTNLLLLVQIQSNTTYDVTGVTYNGVAMTNFQNQAGSGGAPGVSVWYLIAPDTGANNIVASASTASMQWVVGASYTGVSQSAFPDAAGTGSPQQITTNTTNVSASVTTVADNSWTFWAVSKNGGGVVESLTNATGRSEQGNTTYLDSNGAISPAGVYTMSGSDADNKWTMIYGSFAPVAAVVIPPDQSSNFIIFE